MLLWTPPEVETPPRPVVQEDLVRAKAAVGLMLYAATEESMTLKLRYKSFDFYIQISLKKLLG